LQQSLFAERSANPSKSWTVVVCLAEVAAITNQHDCAAFDWALLEECDLTEYQLWAQRGLKAIQGIIIAGCCIRVASFAFNPKSLPNSDPCDSSRRVIKSHLIMLPHGLEKISNWPAWTICEIWNCAWRHCHCGRSMREHVFQPSEI